MTLSKRGDYVVRAALSLARAYGSGQHRKIREVVAEMDVPATYASQILADLVRAELATSKAGKGGGYRLARPPQEVSLLQVVEAGEGPLRAERCALGDGPCRWDTVCPLHETWGAATDALRSTLAETTLAELVDRDAALEAGAYPAPADSHRHSEVTTAIEDWVQIWSTRDQVVSHFASADSWLPGCVRSSYAEADSLRTGLDASQPSWIPRVVTVMATPDGQEPSAGGECAFEEDASSTQEPPEAEVIRLIWEAGGAKGPASRFEGRLRVLTIDDERAELRLKGVFRPPRAVVDAEPHLAEKLARATVRSVLRLVAQAVESAGPPAGARERGPQTAGV